MTMKELTAAVGEDLKHVPEGSLEQSILRMNYNAARRSDLGKNGSHCSRAETMKKVVADLKSRNDFEYLYDREYFK